MLSIVFIAFLKSIHDQIRWNSVDFRPRVTSARAFLQNIDPYAIEWHNLIQQLQWRELWQVCQRSFNV